MTKLTEAQLISSLKQLKEIKPNREWASLLKSQIFAEKSAEPIRAQFSFAQAISNFKFQISNSFGRKLAYSLAAILFLIMGIFGVSTLGNLSQKSTAPLAQQTSDNQQTTIIKSQISATVKNIAQNLKSNPTQDPQAIKILAKTLADIPGDVSTTQDVTDLKKTVVATEIIDLQKTTLTDEQETTLTEAVYLYNKGEYADALEKILLIDSLN